MRFLNSAGKSGVFCLLWLSQNAKNYHCKAFPSAELRTSFAEACFFLLAITLMKRPSVLHPQTGPEPHQRKCASQW